jgi:hypothetical protein
MIKCPLEFRGLIDMFYIRVKQEKLNFFGVKLPTDQFCAIENNAQSNHQTGLNFYEESLHI